MKTSELTGAALDWAAAQAEGLLAFGHRKISDDCVITLSTGEFEIFKPSSNWALAGPIIERECIELVLDGWGAWNAALRGGDKDDIAHGPTPLVAAMRCYVASKLGDEVDVPEELK
jgi:hypothetical protein